MGAQPAKVIPDLAARSFKTRLSSLFLGISSIILVLIESLED